MKKIFLTIMVMLLLTGMAYAECFICDGVASGEYGTKAGAKFLRGVGNTLFGWMELFVSPGREMQEGSHVATAVVAGLGNAVERTSSGLVDILTFWNPTKGEIVTVKNCPICAYTK